MASVSDRAITSLRLIHDDLTSQLGGWSDAQLTGPSGASEWTIAAVLSHLGSGAEISLATLQAATGTGSAPGPEFNEGVWARWNAMSPREQADGFIASDAELVAALEDLTPDQRETMTFELPFLPAPAPLATYVGMRLNEAALHSWDARVGLDLAAGVDPGAAAVIVELLAGDLSFLLGFTGKADALGRPAGVEIAGSGYLLTIADSVALSGVTPDAVPTAAFTGPVEAWLRLMAGRLDAEHTPAAVSVKGDVTLADLRRVFPGY